jgi:hypothetical protein
MAPIPQRVADKPLVSKLDRWSGKKNIDLDFTTWEAIFEERMKTDIDARMSWAFLRSKGCEASALKLCLYGILIDLDNSYWAESWESTLRAATRHTAIRMRKDAEVLFWMSLSYSDEVSYVLQGAYQRLQKAATEADLEAAERSWVSPYRNCFLPVLVSYVCRITNEKHFAHLAAVVRCGCKVDDPNGGYTADAVRKAFNRFRREHPRAWESIEKAVGEWCKNFADFPDRLLIAPNS